jgi:hypothetical protein
MFVVGNNLSVILKNHSFLDGILYENYLCQSDVKYSLLNFVQEF